jgi:hypothetical protein
MLRVPITAMNLLQICLPPLLACLGASAAAADATLEPLKYNHPGLTVDLGVGLWAWPLPMDFDGDGDLDLVVNCPDKPYNGIYFFENATGDTAKNAMPVFKPGVRISKGAQNVRVSYVDGKPVVLTPTPATPTSSKPASRKGQPRPATNIHPNKVRANMWHHVDYDGDGAQDLIVGVGDWTEYGWDNAYDANGRWMNGPCAATSTCSATPAATTSRLRQAGKVMAGDRPVETYGWPSPELRRLRWRRRSRPALRRVPRRLHLLSKTPAPAPSRSTPS